MQQLLLEIMPLLLFFITKEDVTRLRIRTENGINHAITLLHIVLHGTKGFYQLRVSKLVDRGISNYCIAPRGASGRMFIFFDYTHQKRF